MAKIKLSKSEIETIVDWYECADEAKDRPDDDYDLVCRFIRLSNPEYTKRMDKLRNG